ncbi:hypothetical protein [Deinococcus budaensis]|uniref:Uncharacterized protein n=1 Tax=Deinococcus budaensis TaxID=1665626 RepID=A0A7W8LQI9_9DEIO|nr:hypothetical protein [Deinococcus budaensis]MBB5234799.1 hypothetical protein [Deinococcus budaensis]
MHPLAHVPSARPVLERLQQELSARGEPHATVQLLGQAEAHAFDLLGGIRFLDHGARQPGLRCAACATGHGLRYAFYITTTVGEVIGPVGSNCVFTRVLGQEAARRLGRRLEGGLAAFQREQHRAQQQRLLEEAGSWRGYLRELGFEWALLALAGEGHLPAELRATLEQAQARNEPLTAATLAALRAQAAEKPARPRASRFVPASPATFAPSLGPDAAPRPPGRPRRFQAAAGQAMPQDEWQQYVARSRLKAALSNWAGVEALLPFDEPTRRDIKDALDHRRPLRLEHLEAVVQAGREAGVAEPPPETLPEVRTLVRDWQAAAQAREDQRRAEELRHLDLASQQRSGLGVLDVQRDLHVTAAQASWPALQHLLPAGRQAEIRRALDTRFIRADDYAALMRAVMLSRTPQERPEYRTPEHFVTYVGVALRRARAFGPARQLHQLRGQGALLTHLQPFLEAYLGGQHVPEGRLVAAVTAFFQDRSRPAPPPTPAARPASPRAATHTVQLSQAERRAGARLWDQGLPTRLPAGDRAAIARAVHEGQPLTPGQRDLLRSALQAPPRAALTPEEREQLLAAWGRGLAERLPAPERRAIGRLLRQRGDLTAEQQRLLREAQRQLHPQRSPRPALTAQDRLRYAQAWGRGLADHVPPPQRRALSRALHQGGELTPEQGALLEEGLRRLGAGRARTPGGKRPGRSPGQTKAHRESEPSA